MVANQKVVSIDNIKKIVEPAKAIYFADLSQIKATEISSLRSRLNTMNVKVKVVKNRLTKRALSEQGIQGVESFLQGPTAMILSYDDPLVPAKVIKDFSKKNALLKIKGAYLDKSVYSAKQFDYLAALPSKPEILAELVGILQQPAAELVFVLEALIRQLVSGLEELKDNRSKEPTAPASSESTAGEPGN